MSDLPQPPGLARRLLALALPADAREHIVEELDEIYRRRCEQQSVTRAQRCTGAKRCRSRAGSSWSGFASAFEAVDTE